MRDLKIPEQRHPVSTHQFGTNQETITEVHRQHSDVAVKCRLTDFDGEDITWKKSPNRRQAPVVGAPTAKQQGRAAKAGDIALAFPETGIGPDGAEAEGGRQRH